MSGSSAAQASVLDFEAHLGALGGEIEALMRPLVAPLVEKWEWVTGDDEQVRETASRWRMLSHDLTDVADGERAAATRAAADWDGCAHEAFDEAVERVVRDLEQVAGRTSDVADLLDEAANAVGQAERIVAELVRELIEWAVVTLAISAAGAIVTLGASVAAGAAAAAARAGIVGAKIAARLGELALELRRLQLALGVYEVWFKGLSVAQKQLVRAAERGVIGGFTGVDCDVPSPMIDLAMVRLETERSF